jgi:hypothetical protein
MERHELQELHYITHIDNVQSILEHGILSHAHVSRLKHRSVAMPEIQVLRESKPIPGGRRLHEYANLYFCARNPMLYKRRAICDTLCVLRISPEVLDLDGVVVSDQNASSQYARFARAPEGLRIVDRERTFADYWTDSDRIEGWRKKAAKNAEVLVPDRVAPEFIRGAYVVNQSAKERFDALGSHLACQIDRHLFFL